jgi:hypothetical protein
LYDVFQFLDIATDFVDLAAVKVGSRLDILLDIEPGADIDDDMRRTSKLSSNVERVGQGNEDGLVFCRAEV